MYSDEADIPDIITMLGIERHLTQPREKYSGVLADPREIFGNSFHFVSHI